MARMFAALTRQSKLGYSSSRSLPSGSSQPPEFTKMAGDRRKWEKIEKTR
jgi:hypothetical protein